MTNASIPKGTRDFSPSVVRKRNFIIDSIRSTFELYGFEPIETPAMENIETLTGKYGDEGDKLMFRILNNGEIIEPAKSSADTKELIKNISEKALRYDLTIPFARYVVMNRNDITFPFKRYQIQPVWRADRPQKGRFREFFQCDADVIGSNSLLNEVELLNIYADVFSKLKLPVEIKINNRKILAGLAEWMNAVESLTSLTIAIDKLDKIGWDGVKKELAANNFTEEQIAKTEKFLAIKGDAVSQLNQLKEIFVEIEIGKKGIEELEEVISKFAISNLQSVISIDTTLARGLNYYTGIIVEVKAATAQMGSIGGGGRYDNLTGVFGLPNVSGVGISFGLDRIYEVMNELNLFPDEKIAAVKVMFANFGGDAELMALQLVQQLRTENISSLLYPSAEKMKKQFDYADKKNIPFVVIIGDEELKNRKANVKNMTTGEQQAISFDELISVLK